MHPVKPVCVRVRRKLEHRRGYEPSRLLPRRDGLNTLRADRKTAQLREERLREQLEAKEKQLADMEVRADSAAPK